MILPPINFKQWIDDHRELLKPPVGNKVIWQNGDFICMVVGGPNLRTDYHYNQGPEFFYQIEGDMILKIMEQGQPKDIVIQEGDIFLLPPKVPHSPQRSEHSIGFVLEEKRKRPIEDALMWFCERCHQRLYEEYFFLENIETQFSTVFDHFFNNIDHRTCNHCSHLNPAPPYYDV